jgi:hypothetical protein
MIGLLPAQDAGNVPGSWPDGRPNLDPSEVNATPTDETPTIAETIYARKFRDLLDVIDALRECGLESENIPLPKIAMVGPQSSGKSSLIEAISQIRVPRAAGTCTRCPMEIRLRQGGPWTCRVSVRFEIAGNQRTDPFDTTNEKHQVEKILRRAQLAILNPGTPIEIFRSLDPDTYNRPSERIFSKDMVVVEVNGAPVDLTLIDLPGVIASLWQNTHVQVFHI